MSRNVREKRSLARVRVLKRRVSGSSSSPHSTDDDGYSAVEDISDSEDDEDDVTAAEEKIMLGHAFPRSSNASRPQASTALDDQDYDDDEDEADDDENEADSDNCNVQFGHDDNGSWHGIMSEADQIGHDSDLLHQSSIFATDPLVERRVRFDLPSSESDSTETEDDHGDLFPDIFVAQRSLDPAFRREIEHDADDSSGSGSFWDYSGQYGEQSESDKEDVAANPGGNAATMPTGMPQVLDPSFDRMNLDDANHGQVNHDEKALTPIFGDNAELDGYETDGDTTEEELPDPPIRRKIRRPSNAMSASSDSDNASLVKAQRGKPRVGRFNLNRRDKKPIAVLNPGARRMMIFTPKRGCGLDLSPEQYHMPLAMPEPSSPLLNTSANLMMSAMFSSNTFGDFIHGQTGPTEAFFPFASDNNSADVSGASNQDEEDDEENQLDINDFIQWGEEDSSNDEGGADNWQPESTPTRPGTATKESEILAHLKPDTVGAFRRNQVNQKLLLSKSVTQDSLVFSGPYHMTALKGLKSDRFDTAGVPLTPMRRQKKNMSEMVRSPLQSVAPKRKSGSEPGTAHKKQRSISDVSRLRM